MSEQQHTPPIKEFRAGHIKAAIWPNKVRQGDELVVQHSIKVQKSYKDPKSGDWKNIEINVFPSEIPDMRDVLERALEYCRPTKKGDARE